MPHSCSGIAGTFIQLQPQTLNTVRGSSSFLANSLEEPTFLHQEVSVCLSGFPEGSNLWQVLLKGDLNISLGTSVLASWAEIITTVAVAYPG